MAYKTRAAATQFLRGEGLVLSDTNLMERASEGTGPDYVIINGRALYTEKSLLAWIAAQAAKPVRMRRAKEKKNAPPTAKKAAKRRDSETAAA